MTVNSATLTTGTVAEAMTPGILTCLPVTPLRVVAQMMATHRVHAIVVFGHEDVLLPWGVLSTSTWWARSRVTPRPAPSPHHRWSR